MCELSCGHFFAVIFVQGAFFSLRFSVAGGVSMCMLMYEVCLCNLMSHSLYIDDGDPSG